ncbi:hypothetical protein EV126DRAFT_254850 [Verticillium dahliae]|nr:hypothetical protein EV126DRAFT_254850 [Verticillium dahliae]
MFDRPVSLFNLRRFPLLPAPWSFPSSVIPSSRSRRRRGRGSTWILCVTNLRRKSRDSSLPAYAMYHVPCAICGPRSCSREYIPSAPLHAALGCPALLFGSFRPAPLIPLPSVFATPARWGDAKFLLCSPCPDASGWLWLPFANPGVLCWCRPSFVLPPRRRGMPMGAFAGALEGLWQEKQCVIPLLVIQGSVLDHPMQSD